MRGVLVLKDMELVKRLLISDFWHFSDIVFFEKEFDEAPQNDFGLLTTTGKEWKALKSCLTPAFSISQLKDLSKHVSVN